MLIKYLFMFTMSILAAAPVPPVTPITPVAASPSVTSQILSSSPIEAVTIGTSVKGTPIIARRYGTATGPTVLIVGQIHGREKGSLQVIKGIVDGFASKASAMNVWVIDVANPDGDVKNLRTNSRAVDLNRNFPTSDWKLSARGRYFSGKSPMSEPETKALVEFIEKYKPVLSVWYHQVGPVVDPHPMGNPLIMRTYARVVGYPYSAARCAGSCVGTATTFHSETVANATAFVVELPAKVTKNHVERNVAALRAVFAMLAN